MSLDVSGVNQPDVEVTIAKIVIGLVTLWTITWTPYALVSLIGISGYGHILTPFDSMVPALVAKTAACIDPFVYSLNHPKIRHANAGPEGQPPQQPPPEPSVPRITSLVTVEVPHVPSQLIQR